MSPGGQGIQVRGVDIELSKNKRGRRVTVLDPEGIVYQFKPKEIATVGPAFLTIDTELNP